MGAAPADVTGWAPAGEPDVLEAFLDYPGARATLTYALHGTGHCVRVHAVGERGAAALTWSGTADTDPAPCVRLTSLRDGVTTAHDVPARCGHAHDGVHLIEAFARACRGEHTAALPTADDGVRAVRLCLAAEASARERRR